MSKHKKLILPPRKRGEKLSESDVQSLKGFARETHRDVLSDLEREMEDRVRRVIDNLTGSNGQEVIVRSSSAPPFFSVTTRIVD